MTTCTRAFQAYPKSCLPCLPPLQVLALPAARLLPRITPLLLCDNEEAVIEAARVYGNFSRSPEVRDYMQARLGAVGRD